MKVKKITKGPFNISVPADAQVALTSGIGNAQIGGNVLKDGTTIITKGEIKNKSLGTGAELDGRTLKLITNVLDVNPDSNKISITHFFYNGQPAVFEYPQKDDPAGVDTDGDVYSLTVTYKFKSI